MKIKIVKKNELKENFFEFTEMEEINVVKDILLDVKKSGDSAVRKYTKNFDGLDLSNFEISKKEIKEAYEKVDDETIVAIKKAAANIEAFAKKQMQCFKDFTCEINANKLGQKVIPLQKVGVYAPGGLYPYPSSVLMGVIPAKVAGVKDVIVCSPKISAEAIVSADISGVSRIFNIGGVQAIGAMAYGTESVCKVDKIVGPGNKYVTAAKKEVFGVVGIDFLAGPSEVMVIADDSGDRKLIAADLLAQAEHSPDAIAVLVTNSIDVANGVNEEVEKQLLDLKTKEVASQALENALIILVDDINEAIEIANKKAPEHLELQTSENVMKRLVQELVNYGSLFIGKNTAEVFGDYCSGTNHVLPTNGSAKYCAGLSVKDFVKIVTFQEITEEGKEEMINVAAKLAGVEGLDAHKKAALARKK